MKYTFDGRAHRVSWLDEPAFLPVLMRDGAVRLIKWGHRGEDTDALGIDERQFPYGREVRLHTARQLKAVPVKIPIESYLSNSESTGWVEIEPRQALQGAALFLGHEWRVYVVARGSYTEGMTPRIVSRRI